MNIKEDSLNVVRILSLNNRAVLPAPHIAEKTQRPTLGGVVIKSRICVCCGEPMAARGNSLSRNPNMCASCSSLDDGMEQEEGNQAVENDEAGNARGSRLPSTNRNPNRRLA